MQSWRELCGQQRGWADTSQCERLQVSSLAPGSPSLTFITGVRLCAIVVVDFIDSPWLAVWTVTARKRGKGTRWALHPHAVLSLRASPPTSALDPGQAQACRPYPLNHPWALLIENCCQPLQWAAILNHLTQLPLALEFVRLPIPRCSIRSRDQCKTLAFILGRTTGQNTKELWKCGRSFA